ncbi:MAG: T9SS type A sorting domain-containing protein [Bacteroidota bacterium]
MKQTITLLLILFFTNVYSQTNLMKVQPKSGNATTFATQDVRNITFDTSAALMNVKQKNGSITAFLSADLRNITFPPTYTISATAGANGSIAPSGSIVVESGASQSFSITANQGYSVDSVLVDGVFVGSLASYSFTNVTSNHTITAKFKIYIYTITATAGSNGTVTPSGNISVTHGSNQQFTIAANPEYAIDSVFVDGVFVGALTSYTFTNVTANHSITAKFKFNIYTITASAESNGAIAPSGNVLVMYGADTTFTITPNNCYRVDSVFVDGLFVGSLVSYTFVNVTANHTIAAKFILNTYTISANAGANGSISPSGSVSVNCGSSQRFTFTPDNCYRVDSVFVDGVFVDSTSGYTFANISSTHSITVRFILITNRITATAGANGTLFPTGSITVNCGSEQRFVFNPSTGYHVANVLIDGEIVITDSTDGYTFYNIATTHSINVSFAINTFSIVASVVGNGAITPTGNQSVSYGSSKTFTYQPSSGYYVDSVVVDDVRVDSLASYTFTNVIANHTITVKFLQYGSISGITFNDANGNSIKEVGESGLANWSMILSGAASETTATNANGNFSFTEIIAGEYSVNEVEQSGWLKTIPIGAETTIVLSAGENITAIYFGNWQDSAKFRTFRADTSLSKKAVKLKYKNNRLVLQPNIATAVENVFSSIGKLGATFLGVKQTDKNLAKLYAWIAYKKASDLGKLYLSPHELLVNLAFPFDSVRSITDGRVEKKKILSKEIKADRKKYNNKILEQAVCFRLNILGSATSDTTLPNGFSALVLDTSFVLAGRELKGQTLLQIANYTDTLMTYWKVNNVIGFEAYSNLYDYSTKILQRINDDFSAPIETTNYAINKDKIVFTKNVYLIKLLGIKTASSSGIVKKVPGNREEEILFSSVSAEPNTILLSQNYPNPFNPTTAIGFSLLAVGNVSLKIYDVLGREVATLLNNEQIEAGEHEIQFDANGLPSGVYFYRLSAGEFSETKKLVLMK